MNREHVDDFFVWGILLAIILICVAVAYLIFRYAVTL